MNPCNEILDAGLRLAHLFYLIVFQRGAASEGRGPSAATDMTSTGDN